MQVYGPAVKVWKAFGVLWRQGAHLKIFPVAKTIRNYNTQKAFADMLTGINGVVLAFPQAIGYSLITGLPITYGIYGVVLAGIASAVFSRSSWMMLGPTNATSVMLMSAFASLNIVIADRPTQLPVMLLMVGGLLLLGAYLKAANLFQYISRSVTTGYITAAAFLIITNQLGNLLGIRFEEPGTTCFEILNQIFAQIIEVQWPSFAVGLTTLGVFILLDKYFSRLPNILITLLFMSVATTLLSRWGIWVDCIGCVNLDTWHWSLPRWDIENMGRLASTSFALALICGLETISVGKSLSAKAGQRFNANQELMALGIANLGCCFAGGLVASTSPTRSVAALKWGAGTALCSLFGGIFCYLAATAVGPWMNYFPRPVLAVLIMIFGASLINEHVIRMVLRTTQTDAVVFFVTLSAGLLFPLDVAIYIGVITSVVLFLRKVASPEMMEYVFNDSGQLLQLPATHPRPFPEISIVHVEGNLFFGAADLFQEQIRRVCEDPNLKVVILKMRHAHNLDATGVMALEELVQFMRDNHRILLMSETRKEIARVLHSSGLFELIGREQIFIDALDNPTLSTALALKAAQKLLGPGSPQAKITILVDSARPLE